MAVFPPRQEFDGGPASPFSDEPFSIVALEEEQRHTALDVEPIQQPFMWIRTLRPYISAA